MRLILARADDASAGALAARWGADAMVLTPADLHRLRWRLEVDRDGATRTTVGPRGGPDIAVGSVLCRLAAVAGSDLPHVHRDDRDYAAAELTAFLVAWMDGCPAPVLNRPVAGSLNGPPWSPDRWAEAAVAVGLRTSGRPGEDPLGDPGPGCRGCPHPPVAPRPPAGVTVVGDAVLGAAHPVVGARLRDLARLAGTPLLGATVDGTGPDAAVRDVSAWPDLSAAAAADALATALDAGRAAA